MGSDQDQRDKKTAGSAVGAGESLGHYKLISQLGVGGMGEVWEAEDSKLDRRVALKVLPAELAESPERIERFEREAKALAALDHPNIVTIHSVEQSEGVHYLTMGLVSGRTLGELIPDGGMPLDRLLELASPLAGAVAAAHEKGITHRDLKPSNVMVTDDGVVKVLDFGLAKVSDSDAITPGLATEMPTEGLTVEGTVLGTTSYMSPEQVEGKPIDHRSDIFSLGVVLYEMATGIRPFQGDTSAGVMSSILKDQPQPLPEARVDLPRQLGRIIGQCLEKDPPDRFQTARDVHNGLKNLSREVSSDTSWVSSVHAPTEEGPSKATRRWVFVTVVLAVTLVLIWVGYTNDESVGGGIGDDGAIAVESDQPKALAADGPPMIAVLPFENMGAAEDEYFAAGMTEEITTRLASLSEIGVIASNSARKYAGSEKSAPQIGEELGADYLVLGSVRWAQSPDGSSRLRINPRVISTADDVQVWADSYDRVFEDVFGIQSDIAMKVVELLDVTLGESEQASLEDRPTENMEAYDFYLQARAVPGHFANEEALRERIELAKRAVELDPDFAQGWVWLALYESNLYGYGYDRSEGQRRHAKDTIERAVELNMNSPASVHRLYAHYYFHVERDYERALEEDIRAIKFEPNDTVAQSGMAYALRRMGRFEEALVELERAQRLDPRSTLILTQLGSLNTFLGNFEEALVYYDKVIAIDSTTPDIYRKKAEAYLRWTGDVVAARRVLDASPADARPDSHDLAVQFRQLVFEERFEEAIVFLDSLSVEAIGLSTHYRPRSMLAGFTYQLLGDPASAQKAFEEAAAHLEREVEAQPDHVKRVASLGITYAALGRKEEAIRLGIQATEMVPLEREGYFGQTEVLDLAWIYTLVGEYDLAFDQLEILLSRPSWITIPLLKLEPRWAPLLEQPRFQDLEQKYSNQFS